MGGHLSFYKGLGTTCEGAIPARIMNATVLEKKKYTSHKIMENV